MVVNKPTPQQIIKLIGACALFFLGLNYNIKDIGETSGDQYFQDYINQDTVSLTENTAENTVRLEFLLT